MIQSIEKPANRNRPAKTQFIELVDKKTLKLLLYIVHKFEKIEKAGTR